MPIDNSFFYRKIHRSTIYHHLHTFRHKMPLSENFMVHISVTDFYWFVNKKRKQITCHSRPGNNLYRGLLHMFGLDHVSDYPSIWIITNREQKMTTEIKWCTKLHFQFRFWTSVPFDEHWILNIEKGLPYNFGFQALLCIMTHYLHSTIVCNSVQMFRLFSYHKNGKFMASQVNGTFSKIWLLWKF